MELKKSLGLFSVFCIATGAMISSGLFILPGMAFSQTGPAVVISYFLAGLMSLPGMLSLTEMTTAMPKAGGDCFSIMRSMGPAVGTVAGLLSWFSLSMKSAFALIGMSIFTTLIIQLDIHIIAVIFCLIFLIVNIAGIREAASFQNVMVLGLLVLMGGKVAERLKLEQQEVKRLLLEREQESSTAISSFVAIPHIITASGTEFLLVIVRNRQGIYFSESFPEIKAMFFLLGARDERNFHLQCLSALAQIVLEDDFEKRWLSARTENVLRDIILLGKRKR